MHLLVNKCFVLFWLNKKLYNMYTLLCNMHNTFTFLTNDVKLNLNTFLIL